MCNQYIVYIYINLIPINTLDKINKQDLDFLYFHQVLFYYTVCYSYVR